MRQYYDAVWDVPEYDDQKPLRKLVLDTNQAGLSWQTILDKNEAFGEAYDRFDIKKIINCGETKAGELMESKGVIRNRKKIEAAVQNVRAVLKIRREIGSFSEYPWSFSSGKIVDSSYHSQEEVLTTSPLSDESAKDLRKREFKLIGSATIYAFLEAVGIIDDHLDGCFRKEKVVRIGRKNG